MNTCMQSFLYVLLYNDLNNNCNTNTYTNTGGLCCFRHERVY